MVSNQKKIFLLALGILAILIAAYANHFGNGFHFDDMHTIVENPYIRNLKNIPQFFTDAKMFSSDPDHYGLRPIVTTSLAIDYWLAGGLAPFYFHLSTFIWHVLLGVVLYFVYKKLVHSSIQHRWTNYIALFAVAWFVLHTANGETINYVISRSDVLSTFFIVASFAIYILYPEKRKWYLYIIPAVIGVFAKETVLVLVILLFFYIILFEQKLALAELFKAKNFKQVLHTIGLLLPLLIVVIAVQAYTLSKVHAIPGISNPAGYYWLTQCYVWLHYFTSFFLPISLSADTDWTVILNAFDPRILIGVVFVIALLITIFKTSKKVETRPISFGLIWFAAALLPTSLAPFAEVTNDHRMYFAFVGLSLSVVTAISLFLIKKEKQILANKGTQVIICTLTLMILSLNAYGVHQRNKVWKDDSTFWYDVTITSPKNGRGWMNYGLTQMEKGNFEIALSYYEKAQPFLMTYNLLYVNMGIAQGALGLNEEADANFKKAIFFAPQTFYSYVYYADYLLRNSRFEAAKENGEKALALNPYSTMALGTMMAVYHHLGQWSALEKAANQQLVLLPGDTEALKFLAAAREKRPAEPIQNSADAKRKMKAEDYLGLSLALYNLGQYEKCIDVCMSAIRLKPDYADAYSNMAAAYNQLQLWPQGIEASKKALAIDPNHQFAKGNLAWAEREKQ